ncbi:hypothetical protein LI7559_10865 [Bacillus licheniformis LMG 7559]|nr:hypothetical protein LI7559_10865 [Bacillus licheniformis LMG 7559]
MSRCSFVIFLTKLRVAAEKHAFLRVCLHPPFFRHLI